ncbi:hypothetical protein AVEN_246518-1 [Araneus ventricosus]|uniref:Uncharacterized protein n=1 Tax=Araneus ventricosus TaxID=182803 RepID=A0A4Y2LT56_ARAVE|nr:hypothetical protein AVEN_246518-1 [Araneus ventricosus]
MTISLFVCSFGSSLLATLLPLLPIGYFFHSSVLRLFSAGNVVALLPIGYFFCSSVSSALTLATLFKSENQAVFCSSVSSAALLSWPVVPLLPIGYFFVLLFLRLTSLLATLSHYCKSLYFCSSVSSALFSCTLCR